MARVLISFVGTGGNKDGNSNNHETLRVYKTAKYSFNKGKTFSETTFVAKALVDHYKIDKVCLLGTVKSMWEEVYKVFSKDSFNEDIYWVLDEFTAKANANSDLIMPHKEVVEQALGKDSHVELIKYGITKEEIDINSAIILSLEDYLNNGDELIVDITHSFRSLPLLVMNLLIFLQNVSKKKISVSHICYGNIDISRELNYAPVVDLGEIMTINEWIVGAYSLMEFGNGYKIAKLVEKEDKSVANILTGFSDEMNLNHMSGIKSQYLSLSGLKNKIFSPIPARIIPQTVKSFVDKFTGNAKNSVFLFRSAEWQYEHKNYSASYISLLESILVYVSEVACLPMNTSEDMDQAKMILGGKDSKSMSCTERDECRRMFSKNALDKLMAAYRDVNKIRNGLAHQIEIQIGKDKHHANRKELIEILGNNIAVLRDVIK